MPRTRYPEPRSFASLADVEGARGALSGQLRRTVELYLDCRFSSVEAAELLGVTASTVRDRLARAGVARRPRGNGARHQLLANAELARTVFLYERLGMTLEEVGAVLGRHPNTVLYRLRVAGARTRPRGGRQAGTRATETERVIAQLLARSRRAAGGVQ